MDAFLTLDNAQLTFEWDKDGLAWQLLLVRGVRFSWVGVLVCVQGVRGNLVDLCGASRSLLRLGSRVRLTFATHGDLLLSKS